jgi:hypothetical protein
MKPTKYYLKKERRGEGREGLRECNRGGEYNQNTFYTSTEISQ